MPKKSLLCKVSLTWPTVTNKYTTAFKLKPSNTSTREFLGVLWSFPEISISDNSRTFKSTVTKQTRLLLILISSTEKMKKIFLKMVIQSVDGLILFKSKIVLGHRYPLLRKKTQMIKQLVIRMMLHQWLLVGPLRRRELFLRMFLKIITIVMI